jgi:beta-phosphoglucomutase family hydrolase
VKHWAAIFDWDGVIIDSSSQHERGWAMLAEEERRALPPGFFRRSFGMKNEKVIPDLLGWTNQPVEIRRLSLRKEEFYRELMAREGIELLPGVKTWLEQLREAGIPCVVGSSTPRLNIDCVIGQLGIADYFQALVTAEDVTRGKPDPQVFLTAAQKLGAPPAECVVFEDAHVGIEAARAAGMKVIALATTHPANTLREADLVIGDLRELSLVMVSSLFAAERF